MTNSEALLAKYPSLKKFEELGDDYTEVYVPLILDFAVVVDFVHMG